MIISRFVKGFANWYSEQIYPLLVGVIGRISGMVSFSVVELGLYIFIVTFGVLMLFVIFKKNKRKQFVEILFLITSVLVFLYVINCGINYQRDSFSDTIGMKIETYTVDELAKVCELLTDDVNCLSELVLRDDEGVMLLSNEEQKEAVHAMEALALKYPVLTGYYPVPKELINPWILAVQQVTGIYSPFTIEANYNNEMVDYNIPFTMCHELSHLRGFMQEQEANFIAYLACMESGNIEFQYSGSLLGWIYCMNALYRVDKEAWEEIRMKLSPMADVDLQANSQYWDRYDGRVAEMADKMNDTYLKANGQKDGVKSYNRMVDLMVMYHR